MGDTVNELPLTWSNRVWSIREWVVPRSSILFTVFVFGFSLSSLVLAETFSEFSQKGLDTWEPVEFEGETLYKLDSEGGSTVLRAQSQASASGWVKKETVNLTKTPVLEWRWRVDQAIPELDEATKKGDDYAARIYVIVKDGWFFWQTKALNYVWSSQANPPKTWPNAFAPDNAVMLPLRTSRDKTGHWVSEKRNIRQDLKRAFGKDFDEIEAIAIMTDTDNSGLSAGASYGELVFKED